jgi:ABC-type lipoprotein release transport system permease subunit
VTRLRRFARSGHGPAVTTVTAVTVGIRIARAVTAVIIMLAVTAVTRRAFVTRPRGIGPPWAL